MGRGKEDNEKEKNIEENSEDNAEWPKKTRKRWC